MRGTLATVATPDGQGAGFGANSWLVEEMYEQFVADPDSVGESWQEFFADYHSQAPSVAAAAAASPQVRAIAEVHGVGADAESPDAAAAEPGDSASTPTPWTSAIAWTCGDAAAAAATLGACEW